MTNTLAIGFANKFYTLWNVSEEQSFFVDAAGNKHVQFVNVNNHYIKNISMNLEEATAQYPGVPVIEDLRGKSNSWRETKKVELPANLITFGKYLGRTIEEVATTDLGYIKWLAKNATRSQEQLDLINSLPEIIADQAERATVVTSQQELDNKDSITSGLTDILFVNNGEYITHNLQINGGTWFADDVEDFTNYIAFTAVAVDSTNQMRNRAQILVPESMSKLVSGRFPYGMILVKDKFVKVKNKTFKVELVPVIENKWFAHCGNISVFVLKNISN